MFTDLYELTMLQAYFEQVMDRRIGVGKAAMTTVHAYTSSQAIVDGPAKRCGAAVPGPRTACRPRQARRRRRAKRCGYRGRFDGIAIRAPVSIGSIADITFVTERGTTVDEVNTIFCEEAESNRYRGFLGVTDEPIVSADIVKDARASIVDLESTQVVAGDLVKIMSWYDNEWAYAAQMVREAVRMLAK